MNKYGKRTIIEGINVSECEYFEDGMCLAERDSNGYTNIECEFDCPDCNFRKLKRAEQELQAKEQECEELKSENFTFEELIKTQEKLIDRYEQALNDIEKYQNRNCETCVFANTQKCNISCQVFVIFDIINKAKEQ